jgi:ribosomal protein S18 acetylase RimI-like enzyme
MVHYNLRPDIFKPKTTKYNEEQVENILEDENKPVFLFCDEENIHGYAFCEITNTKDDILLQDNKTIYIDDICVDENFRGKGVGRTLYEYVKDYAKNEGCYNITLNVWTCNPGAMEFYKTMGMTEQKIGMEQILG